MPRCICQVTPSSGRRTLTCYRCLLLLDYMLAGEEKKARRRWHESSDRFQLHVQLSTRGADGVSGCRLIGFSCIYSC